MCVVAGLPSSYLGPLDSVWVSETAKLKNVFIINTPEDKVDMTSKWSPFGVLKLKDSHTAIENTTSTFVFVGSETSRRSPPALLKRKLRRNIGKGDGKKGGGKWR